MIRRFTDRYGPHQRPGFVIYLTRRPLCRKGSVAAPRRSFFRRIKALQGLIDGCADLAAYLS
jgi:hypothetical protein